MQNRISQEIQETSEFVTSRIWITEDTWVSALDSRKCVSGTALMHSHYRVEDWLIRRSDVMWYVIDTADLPKQPPHTFLPHQPKSPTHDTVQKSLLLVGITAACSLYRLWLVQLRTFTQCRIIRHAHRHYGFQDQIHSETESSVLDAFVDSEPQKDVLMRLNSR